MNKEIMEIIEPYTDKTLSEGCYIEKTSPTWVIYLEKIIWLRNDDNSYPIRFNPKTTLTRDNETFNYWEWKSYIKILWHYDITAVRKCILKSSKVDFQFDEWDDYFYFQLKEKNNDWDNKVIRIPAKPLSLYTTQENTDLLPLLKELW